jgi:hypothetical protein
MSEVLGNYLMQEFRGLKDNDTVEVGQQRAEEQVTALEGFAGSHLN